MKIFVTGTDTGVGKTTVSVALLQYYRSLGLQTLGLKPVGTGAHWFDGRLMHEDALALRSTSTVQLDYQHHNPVLFEPPIAPQFAASQVNCSLSVDSLQKYLTYALSYPTDITLLEGAGGWYVPLNDQETLADFVISNQWAVILVVGIRLGCLNHAILTYQAIRQSGINLLGWVANCMTKDVMNASMIHSLQTWLRAPLIGRVNPDKQLELCTLDASLRWHDNLILRGVDPDDASG